MIMCQELVGEIAGGLNRKKDRESEKNDFKIVSKKLKKKKIKDKEI